MHQQIGEIKPNYVLRHFLSSLSLFIFEPFFSRSVETTFNCIENAYKPCGGISGDILAKAKEDLAKYGCKKLFRKIIHFCWVGINFLGNFT